MDSDRGIFGACKVRSILEKLIYQDEYEKIDDNLSDSNAGGRKERNIRDNLFVIYAVINKAIKNKKAVEIQFYDLSNCFDSMWAAETMNDIYDAGIKDDKFALVSLLNEKCKVTVKTPVGETESFLLGNIEMQGTVTAPLKCSVQIDTLGRDCYRSGRGLYQYRGACTVPPLGFQYS